MRFEQNLSPVCVLFTSQGFPGPIGSIGYPGPRGVKVSLTLSDVIFHFLCILCWSFSSVQGAEGIRGLKGDRGEKVQKTFFMPLILSSFMLNVKVSFELLSFSESSHGKA